MTHIENTNQLSPTAFATLLGKLGNAFEGHSEDVQFSALEAATAGAFIEDAVSDRDVMEARDGH